MSERLTVRTVRVDSELKAARMLQIRVSTVEEWEAVGPALHRREGRE